MNMRWLLSVAAFCASFILCAQAQVEMAIVPGKAVYVAGEPVYVTVKITNTSAGPLTIVVPSVDSCMSAIRVVVEELRRSDLAPCSAQGGTFCNYDGPGSQFVEIQPQHSHEMRRLLNFIYEFHQPGTYHAHAHIDLEYLNEPIPVARQRVDTKHLVLERNLLIEMVTGDSAALQAAFAPVLADLNSDDFMRQWHAQHVLLNLAPRFSETQILEWLNRIDLELEAIAALRKLGTKAAIGKLEAIAFEEPDQDQEREQRRQAALDQLKYINDKSLLPKLLAITTENGGKMIPWNAATAAARIGHGDAVPTIAKMLTRRDSLITFAGAKALGETLSPDAV